jgi:hypothetical protein
VSSEWECETSSRRKFDIRNTANHRKPQIKSSSLNIFVLPQKAVHSHLPPFNLVPTLTVSLQLISSPCPEAEFRLCLFPSTLWQSPLPFFGKGCIDFSIPRIYSVQLTGRRLHTKRFIAVYSTTQNGTQNSKGRSLQFNKLIWGRFINQIPGNDKSYLKIRQKLMFKSNNNKTQYKIATKSVKVLWYWGKSLSSV